MDDQRGSTPVATVSRGIHPQVRRLCRDAARAINRYPVKDPLVFETSDMEDDEFEDEGDEEEDIDVSDQRVVERG